MEFDKETIAVVVIAILLGAVFGYAVNFLFGGAVSSDFGSSANIGFAFNYTDGTTKKFNIPALSLLPLTITDTSGNEISTIDILLYASLRAYSTVNQWSISGTQQVEVYKRGESVPKTSSTATVSASGSSWASGEQKQIYRTSLSWSQIEGAIQTYGEGTWSLQALAQLSIHVSVADGNTADATAPRVSGIVEFVYLNGIQSFTVTIEPTPIFP